MGDTDNQNDGAPNTEPVSTPPATASVDDSVKKLEALQAQLAQQQATNQKLVDYIQRQQAQQPADEEDEDEDDPKVLVSKATKPLLEQLESLRRQVDVDQAERQLASRGYSVETRSVIDAAYAQWLQQGITVNGRPPSKADVADFVVGKLVNQGKEVFDRQPRGNTLDATVELGGRAAPRGTGITAVNPDTLPRSERLKPGGYWESKLDKPGGW
jgi:hypothetical protein